MLEFFPGHFYLFHKGDRKLFFHLSLGRAVFPPSLNCGHLFISPIFPQKCYVQKSPAPPPPYSNGGPLSDQPLSPMPAWLYIGGGGCPVSYFIEVYYLVVPTLTELTIDWPIFHHHFDVVGETSVVLLYRLLHSNG